MKVVLAPGSFKESVSAGRAASAMAQGVRLVWPHADCLEVPMADGGDGTTDALVAALGGDLVCVTATGPLGGEVRANYGWIEDERLAVIEVAAVVGMRLVAPGERDILRASSVGVGELILDALDHGASHLIIGLGGSLTNDGGAGMLGALGARLLTAAGLPVEPGPVGLEQLRTADLTTVDPRLGAVRIDIASDVTSPLLGAQGASAVFGPQKGATPEQIPRLNAALAQLADQLERHAGADIRRRPGAGAAGGLGAALMSLGATMRRGVELVIDATHLEEALVGADLCLTGEGSVDHQTLNGKTPFGVAQAARRAGVPVIVFAGRIGPGAEVLLDLGASALLPINQSLTSLDDALAHGDRNLRTATASAMRVLALGAQLDVHGAPTRPDRPVGGGNACNSGTFVPSESGRISGESSSDEQTGETP